MFKFLALIVFLFSLLALADETSNNLPDFLDDNSTPASEEKRKGEIIDSRDSLDFNETRAEEEEREEDESIDLPLVKDGEEKEKASDDK